MALVALQALVDTNHALATTQSHAVLNAVMSTVNYGCVVFGLSALRLKRRAVGRRADCAVIRKYDDETDGVSGIN
jgi:hypothetical protein